MIDGFYVRHRTRPQPTRPAELHDMQSGLGDGYSVEPQASSSRSTASVPLPAGSITPRRNIPNRCSLWRKLDWDAALIWRRRGNITEWVLDPGDGAPERKLPANPDYTR